MEHFGGKDASHFNWQWIFIIIILEMIKIKGVRTTEKQRILCFKALPPHGCNELPFQRAKAPQTGETRPSEDCRWPLPPAGSVQTVMPSASFAQELPETKAPSLLLRNSLLSGPVPWRWPFQESFICCSSSNSVWAPASKQGWLARKSWILCSFTLLQCGEET